MIYYVVIIITIFLVLFSVYMHCTYAEPRQVFAFRGINVDDFYNTNVEYKIKSSQKSPQKSPRKPSQKLPQKKKKGWKFEEECRSILEKIYNLPFTSVRPSFLRNPITNHNLELDCYNDELKLAIEYDGSQHAQYTPKFHGDDKWKFIYQVRKDDWKNLKCKENGVTLVRIPHYIPFDKLEQYIRTKLKKINKL